MFYSQQTTMPTELTNLYSEIAQDATLRLQSHVKHCIAEHGDISFAQYMQLALYHPELGYYTRGQQNVGKSGDFFTSVSVGSCFGIILAHRIHSLWENQPNFNQAAPFHLIEIGANSGQLAKDILDTIQQQFPNLYTQLRYHIAEHLEAAKLSQLNTLKNHQDRLTHHTELAEISETQGIIISNELIDAFPVHLLQLQNNQWNERLVTVENDELTFILSENLSPELEAFTQTLPQDLPEGYQTEYRPAIDSFTQAARNALQHSTTITIDYGHTHSAYYQPSRSTGTLRCYHQHQADEAPLDLPGLKDITAHVDFTQLANSYLNADHYLTHFSAQSHYLTTHARDWLIQLENELTDEDASPQQQQLAMKSIRQFQTLTHPTIMGHQFYILETSTQSPSTPDTLALLEV